jgi:hypothetical protein
MNVIMSMLPSLSTSKLLHDITGEPEKGKQAID